MYARAGEAIAEIAEEDRADGWPCVACGSCRTDREPLGGGNLQTHKTETWGSKDAPDSTWAVSCRACGHEWREPPDAQDGDVGVQGRAGFHVGGVVPGVRARVADGGVVACRACGHEW